MPTEGYFQKKVAEITSDYPHEERFIDSWLENHPGAEAISDHERLLDLITELRKHNTKRQVGRNQ